MTSFPARIAPWLAALSLAACSAPPTPTPAPPPPPPAALPPPPAAKWSADWREWPVAPGNWSYAAQPGGSAASFGVQGAAAELVLRCDLAERQLRFARSILPQGQGSAGEMQLHTSFDTARWPAAPAVEQGIAVSLATRTASDGALDRLAFTRGRFAIEAPGATPMAFPLWAEVVRVIEDCRS